LLLFFPGGSALAKSGAAVEILTRDVDEETPRLVIADGALDPISGTKKSLAPLGSEPDEILPFRRGYIGAGVIGEPAEALDEGHRSYAVEIFDGFPPIQSPAGGRHNVGRFADAPCEIGAINAVDNRLFTI
jgi:hypothetical protein